MTKLSVCSKSEKQRELPQVRLAKCVPVFQIATQMCKQIFDCSTSSPLSLPLLRLLLRSSQSETETDTEIETDTESVTETGIETETETETKNELELELELQQALALDIAFDTYSPCTLYSAGRVLQYQQQHQVKQKQQQQQRHTSLGTCVHSCVCVSVVSSVSELLIEYSSSCSSSPLQHKQNPGWKMQPPQKSQ